MWSAAAYPCGCGIGGWAQQFIKVGASAFIGTLWSVTDVEARKFTEVLYTQLCKPIKLSEAVQKARDSFRDPGDVSHGICAICSTKFF